jgi:hypothetical protein
VAIVQTCTDVMGCLEWVDGENCADDPTLTNGICSETMGVALCEEEEPCLDKSGSMQAAFGTSTRWDTVRTVVDNVTTGYQDKIKFGAKWFPSDVACEDLGGENELWCFGTAAQNTNGCSENNLLNPIPILAIRGEQCSVDNAFDVAPAIDNHDPIMAALPQTAQITNACLTPTEHAYNQAMTALDALPAGEDKSVMLLIDGAITDGTDLRQHPVTLGFYSLACLNDDPTTPPIASMMNNHGDLVNTIASAAAAGINTYVVAIDPDAEGTVAQADQYADAGGVPNPASLDPARSFYEATDLPGLDAAMDAIAAAVVTCDIQLSVAPAPGIGIDVSVNDGMGDVLYPEITMAECATLDGWYFSDAPTNQTITLCGQACLDFKDTLDVTVDFFCDAG